ncbi:hypothetical protein KSC_029980 [Ktedonobacter sp. SOSP1-52]|uniref:DUF4185 domain-containing protein n=1 Tax=Ktedonobacter sp. SOSP1-52 TaxID=2778366 RepID=UPI0019169358|nr:DUF4185 domain-containing protein [Ktedonobacter sp. SOSP1-52]GHO64106.1 hypothetical protein KSC_029980 [Ktedonobacter sp. SOSP1-52]
MMNRRIVLKGLASLAGVAPIGALVYWTSKGTHVLALTKTPRTIKVASTKDLGTVDHPKSVAARDGGATALIGGQLLWTFNDTLVAGDSHVRSSSAALAAPTNPLAVHEPLDAKGAPYPFVPFTADEQVYNDSTGKPDDRIAIWPGSVINYQGGGLVYSYKLKVQPGFLNYQFIGIALAHVQAGKTVATRESGLLFTYPEPDFVNAMIYNNTVYVFGRPHNMDTSNGPYVAARAPLALATNRSAYTFWNGSSWTSDVNQAAPLFTDIPGAMTVSYNPYLKQFLVVYSQGLTNNVVMQTAPSIIGPWSRPFVAFAGLPPSQGGTDYAGIEHPELAKNGGRTIYISYYRTLSQLTGEMHLVEVNFQ